MLQSILVPLDGSVFAEQALPLAASIARRSGAALRLLRVVPPLADYFFWAPLPGDPLEAELRQQHRSEAQDYLDGVVARLKKAGAGVISREVLEEEDGISESIGADVARNGVNLVVITTHGRGTAARVWLGSIADKLVRSLPVPVLLVRSSEHPHVVADLNQQLALQHLLIALDGTPLAERILQPAIDLGTAMSADYTLVTVVRSPWTALTRHQAQQIEDQRRKAGDYLEKVAERLRAKEARAQTRVCVADEPAPALLQQAAASGADLIALETHGRGGLGRLLLGSVADKVVRGSSIPVLIGRPSPSSQ